MDVLWQLEPETYLKEGLYKIVRPLDQDDSGITYEAEHVPEHRRVYVREFFLQDRCERFFSTSRMAVVSGEDPAEVSRLREEFVREGREKKDKGTLLDVFEENRTAYYVMKSFSGRIRSDSGKVKSKPVPASEPVRKEPVTEEPVRKEPVTVEPVKIEPVKVEPVRTAPVKEEPVRKEPELKPSQEPAPKDAVVPEKPKAPKKPKGTKEPRHNGIWIGSAIGLAVLALFFLLRPHGAGETVQTDESVIYPTPVVEKDDSREEPKKSVTEREQKRYLDMVGTCRDSIGVWGDFRGTVPTDALALLKEIKGKEKEYGQYADGFDESAELADGLLKKMETARESWEKAGDDQRPISTERARSCYDLALKLAEAIGSVKQEVLETEDGKARIQGDISRIRNKMEGLE